MSKYNAQKSKELRSQRSLLLFESGIKSEATLKAYTYQLDKFSKFCKVIDYDSLVKTVLLKWIIKNNFPKGFQILCHNCNSAKAVYGKCPHEK